MKNISHEFKEHFFLSITLASVITILHHFGVLAWLDQAILHISATFYGENLGHQNKITIKVPDPLVVAIISKTVYENEFNQSSPLDRNKVAVILTNSFLSSNQTPDVIAFDLDLSPYSGDIEYEAKQNELDRVLKLMLDRGIKIVLPLPVRVVSNSALIRKLEWMKKICTWSVAGSKKQVAFASTRISLTANSSIMYDPAFPSLGIVAFDLDNAVDYCAKILNKKAAPEFGRFILSDSGSANEYYETALAYSEKTNASLRPYNPIFFDDGFVKNKILNLSTSEVLNNTSWAGKVVFFGGAYDNRDSFNMPTASADQNIPGVLIHAAIFYSKMHPISMPPKGVDFALDVFLGIVMAYLFHWSWGVYSNKRYETGQYSSVRWHLECRGLLVFNFMLMVAALLFFLYLTAIYLYPNELWLNVAPIVMGVFLKFVVATRQSPDEKSHHEFGSNNQEKPVSLFWVDAGTVLILLLIAIGMLFLH